MLELSAEGIDHSDAVAPTGPSLVQKSLILTYGECIRTEIHSVHNLECSR
jgi:hypothetical protein